CGGGGERVRYLPLYGTSPVHAGYPQKVSTTPFDDDRGMMSRSKMTSIGARTMVVGLLLDHVVARPPNSSFVGTGMTDSFGGSSAFGARQDGNLHMNVEHR